MSAFGLRHRQQNIPAHGRDMESCTASLDLFPEATDCSRHVKLVPGAYPHDVCVRADLSISLTAGYPSHICCKLYYCFEKMNL